MHGAGEPSEWLVRWAHLLPARATVLDLACGRGRHLRWLAGLGHRVTGVDRDAEALAGLSALGETVEADIEAGPWPVVEDGQPPVAEDGVPPVAEDGLRGVAKRRFDAVIVTNYLWRPLWPALFSSLAPGGLYLHETFAAGHEELGRPRRPQFLLQPGELLRACAGLDIVAFEEGRLEQPPRVVQRIAARRPAPTSKGGLAARIAASLKPAPANLPARA